MFSQIRSLRKSFAFVHPTSPGISFTVNPSYMVTQVPSKTPNTPVAQMQFGITLPAWLTAVDANGNPTHPTLLLAVSEGSVTLA